MSAAELVQFLLVQLAAGLFGAVLGASIQVDLIHGLLPGIP